MRPRAAASAAGCSSRLRAAVVACVFVAAQAGCGYTLVQSNAVPDDVKTLRVRVETPATSDALLADALSREMRRVVRWNGRFRTVDSGAADAELVLRVTADRTRAVAFNEFDEVLDYQATIAIDAELKRSAGDLLWSADRIAATRGQAAVEGAVVTSSSAFQGTEVVERQALSEFDGVQLGEERRATARGAVMRELAETVYARMVEGL